MDTSKNELEGMKRWKIDYDTVLINKGQAQKPRIKEQGLDRRSLRD